MLAIRINGSRRKSRMQTNIDKQLLENYHVREAEKILRACVHCGFCTATCPTYQLLGDELDGPRGRIYLIKQVLEGNEISRRTQTHLDRCLTCRNCESTCPSGVRYSQLLDTGRDIVNARVERPALQKLQFSLLRKLFLNRPLFTLLLRTGQLLRPLLPATLSNSIPEREVKTAFVQRVQQHKVLLVSGCVQPALKPNIDTAARIVLDRLGIECIEPPPTCCGSLSHHLGATGEALAIIRQNIDNWLPLIEQHDIKTICMTASGCGVAISEYARLLADDPAYADRAKRISGMYRDPGEVVMQMMAEDDGLIELLSTGIDTDRRIAFHPPCTLQHGLQKKNLIEPLLERSGFTLVPFADTHLCCGSAGTYSITQKALSLQLRDNKLGNIEKAGPDMIVTANIGCQLHLQGGTSTPVKHWLELFV